MRKAELYAGSVGADTWGFMVLDVGEVRECCRCYACMEKSRMHTIGSFAETSTTMGLSIESSFENEQIW